MNSSSEWTFPIRSGPAGLIEESVRDIYVAACCAVGDDLEFYVESRRIVPVRWTIRDGRPQSEGLLIGLDATDTLAGSYEASGYRFGFNRNCTSAEATVAVAEATQDWLADFGIRWPYREGVHLTPTVISGRPMWTERGTGTNVAEIGALLDEFH